MSNKATCYILCTLNDDHGCWKKTQAHTKQLIFHLVILYQLSYRMINMYNERIEDIGVRNDIYIGIYSFVNYNIIYMYIYGVAIYKTNLHMLCVQYYNYSFYCYRSMDYVNVNGSHENLLRNGQQIFPMWRICQNWWNRCCYDDSFQCCHCFRSNCFDTLSASAYITVKSLI